MTLEIFKKQPLGGVDRRAMVGALAEHGTRVAVESLAADRKLVTAAAGGLAKDAVVLILGGSNGITRGLAVQLVFGEKAAICCVHLDSEKMQIGPHHTKVLAAEAEKTGVFAKFFNEDATKPDTVKMVVEALKKGAFDFLEKPYSDNNLKERLKQIQTKHKARITDDLIITGAQEKE